MQCNNNWFRFIYSFNVRDAREKNSQSKIHKCNFFWEENCFKFDFTIILGAKEYLHICNIGTFVGLPFLSNLEVFCIFKNISFKKKNLLLAFFENSLKKSFGF